MSEADLAQAELELGYTIVRSPLSGHISERNVDLGTLVGPGGKSLLATIVKSDTVLVDFSMTALDYLKSKERNINLGQQDSTRSWQPNITITLADNTVYPLKDMWILPNRKSILKPELSLYVQKCRIETSIVAGTIYKGEVVAGCS